MDTNKTSIIVSDYYILIDGAIQDNNFHKHYAIQAVFNLTGGFTLSTKNRERFITSGAVIDGFVSHKMNCERNERQLLLLIEPDSVIGDPLRRLFDQKGTVFEIPLPDLGYDLVGNPDFNNNDVEKLISLLTGNSTKTASAVQWDPRIEKTQVLLREEFSDIPRIAEIASQVGLSESRLQHLFKQDIGVSISKYVIWQRMKEAFRLVLGDNRNLTYTAYQTGFTDSAYLSRTFKQFFGFSPSKFMKNSRNLQVRFL